MTEVNSGSPVGPGFVVYEREPGKPGYDLALAKASVGPGWHELLRMFFDYADAAIRGHDWDGAQRCLRCGVEASLSRDRRCQPIVVVQVKEKLGTLRIYFQGGNEYALGFSCGLEAASSMLCEACGARGRIRDHRDGRAWVLTLCDECQKKPRPLEW